MSQARFTGKRSTTVGGRQDRTLAAEPAPVVERFHTSATDRWSFRTCRRRWWLETIRHLAPKTNVAWYLIFGDCVHVALDKYYRYNRNLKRCLTAFANEWERQDDLLQQKFSGFYSMGIGEEWHDQLLKGKEMLTQYHTYDRIHPFFDEILELSIEDRGFVDILNEGRQQEGLPLLSGRVDMVVRRKDGIWIVDHKALASKPTVRYLDIDDQLTAYCYIYYRLTGEKPRGAMYNVLIKDPPRPPRILNDGKPSRDKAQRTTFEHYMQTLKDLGLDPVDYEEILNFLSSKGWEQFFVRDITERNMDQLTSFEAHLAQETKDMLYVLQDPEERAYPNPSQYTCPGCAVLPICQTMEERGNVDWVTNHGFIETEPRIEIPPKVLSPKWKGV